MLPPRSLREAVLMRCPCHQFPLSGGTHTTMSSQPTAGLRSQTNLEWKGVARGSGLWIDRRDDGMVAVLRADLLSHTAAWESYNQEPQPLQKPGRTERQLSAVESLLDLGTAGCVTAWPGHPTSSLRLLICKWAHASSA